MKILLLHPEDSPSRGPWSNSRWDLIVDLGFASSNTYEEWTRRLGARVFSIYQFAGQSESYRWVNRILDRGRGQLFDRMGLDWWEILAVWSFHDLQALYLAKQLQREIDVGSSEIVASRPHSFTRVLELVLGCRIRYAEKEKRSPLRRAAHMLQSLRRLRPAQIAEIACDKWDTNFQLRRHISRHKRAAISEPAVLLPSAYSNVTRAVLAYAVQLPHRRFLLVTTRRSAVPASLPSNVTTATLAAYALPSSTTAAETAELRNSWQNFLRTMTPDVEEFRHASDAGFWDYFPHHLENGLRLRDAWKNVLECEPVKGVLCGDDLNYFTRLPLLLAYHSDLQAVYCSHGALDGGFLFKMPIADTFLVKGEMESDYLQSVRNIEAKKIYVGAPGSNASPNRRSGGQRDDAIVFFSQPYEIEGGRADSIYAELLPHLYRVGERVGRKLVVKLHPFESLRDRKALVASILPKNSQAGVEVVNGVPAEEIMARTWCGIAIDSSVAVECALREIPFFMCGWLDFMGVGYLRQFARFGVGRVLDSPENIEQIPAMVAEYRANPVALQRLWHQADSVELERIMFGMPNESSSEPFRQDSPLSEASVSGLHEYSSTQLRRDRKVV